LHFIHKGIGCSEDHAVEVARALYQEKKTHEHRTRGGCPVLSQIVEADEGNEEEDDITRLRELIALAEAGSQAEEDEDDTARLSELLALAKAGLQAKEDAFLSQAVDEAEAAYFKQQADQGNVGEPSHMNEAKEDMFLSQAADEAEAAYYRRQADQGNIGEPSHSNEVVVED